MMYSNGLALAIKASGKVLREFKDKVFIPFGSEYSVFLKNQSTQRAVAHITIDGQSVDGGGGFIINGGSELEVERFVKSLDKGNRFKFIERTGKIENHRGIEIDDGLICVEFQFEKRAPKVEYQDVHHYERHHYHPDYWQPYYPYRPRLGDNSWHNTNWYGGASFSGRAAGASGGGGGGGVKYRSAKVTNSIDNGSGIVGSAFLNQVNVNCAAPTQTLTTNQSDNDVGITVPGSESSQQFSYGYVGALETEKYSMIIHLLGETLAGKQVSQPVTVKHKKTCDSCGTENKHSSKFCKECGTALEVIA